MIPAAPPRPLMPGTSFRVISPGKLTEEMHMKTVYDVDLHAAPMISRNRAAVLVGEGDGEPRPYAVWRATRSEPRREGSS